VAGRGLDVQPRLAGFAAMIPFFYLSFYEGPVTKALGGADLSFIVGLLVSGALYLVLARSQRRSASDAPLDLGEEPSLVSA
jgi:purine-cytosine permease-like protein